MDGLRAKLSRVRARPRFYSPSLLLPINQSSEQSSRVWTRLRLLFCLNVAVCLRPECLHLSTIAWAGRHSERTACEALPRSSGSALLPQSSAPHQSISRLTQLWLLLCLNVAVCLRPECLDRPSRGREGNVRSLRTVSAHSSVAVSLFFNASLQHVHFPSKQEKLFLVRVRADSAIDRG